MYCKFCGKQLNKNVSFCKYCGKSVIKDNSIRIDRLIEAGEKKQFMSTNKKTISYLNSKAWYRFIKVIYILCVFFVILIEISIVISEYQPKFDNNNSYITCHDGRKINLKENNIYLYRDYISFTDENRIKNICKTDKQKSLDEIWANTKVNNSKNYELVAIYKPADKVEAIGVLFIFIVITLLFFEIIKRIFYYIAFGTIKPAK